MAKRSREGMDVWDILGRELLHVQFYHCVPATYYIGEIAKDDLPKCLMCGVRVDLPPQSVWED